MNAVSYDGYCIDENGRIIGHEVMSDVYACLKFVVDRIDSAHRVEVIDRDDGLAVLKSMDGQAVWPEELANLCRKGVTKSERLEAIERGRAQLRKATLN